MKKTSHIILAGLVILAWAACAGYLFFDQLVAYENKVEWLDWLLLIDLAGWALRMPWIIALTCIAALALIWAYYSHLRMSAGIRRMLAPTLLVVVTATSCSALWIEYRRAEHFIHLVAGTDTHIQVDAEKRELIWSGRISYYMPNIVFTHASAHPEGDWTLVLNNVPGGSVDASSALVGLADDFRIHTARIDGDCYSMCPNIWISFPNLEIVKGSRLGWHGLYEAETRQPMRSSIDKALLPFLVEKGMPEALARSWVNLPMGEFHEMTVDDVATLGLGVRVLQKR